jgi:large subunit ribosomal protein L17
MRHQKKSQKFHRTEEERKRLWIDLSSGLILNGQVVTFTTRAKWFRSKLERLITLAKRAGEDRQLAFRKVRPFLSEKVARKLVEEVAPKYNDVAGGYTQLFKLSFDFNDKDKSLVKLS